MTKLDTRAVARFHTKTTPGPDGCTNWTGKLDNGYGRFWLDGRCLLAHRVAWEIANGPVPSGLQLDHLCRNRACVEATHLEPVTVAENVLRGVGITAVNAAKTECKNGHQLTGRNLYVRRDGNRNCVPCQRQNVRNWRAAQAVAA